MIILLWLLLAGAPKIQIQLELRHEGFTGRSMPVQGFKKEERLKEIRKTLQKLCRECEVTNKRGDYRIVFTVNHRPYGELSELIWEVRDRDNNEVGRGWSYVTYRAVSYALEAVNQSQKRRKS